jgi:hypothetical protein
MSSVAHARTHARSQARTAPLTLLHLAVRSQRVNIFNLILLNSVNLFGPAAASSRLLAFQPNLWLLARGKFY